MKSDRLIFAQNYKEALLAHLKMGPLPDSESVPASFLETLKPGRNSKARAVALARLHEQTMVQDVMPHCPVEARDELLQQAGRFLRRSRLSSAVRRVGGRRLPPR